MSPNSIGKLLCIINWSGTILTLKCWKKRPIHLQLEERRGNVTSLLTVCDTIKFCETVCYQSSLDTMTTSPSTSSEFSTVPRGTQRRALYRASRHDGSSSLASSAKISTFISFGLNRSSIFNFMRPSLSSEFNARN